MVQRKALTTTLNGDDDDDDGVHVHVPVPFRAHGHNRSHNHGHGGRTFFWMGVAVEGVVPGRLSQSGDDSCGLCLKLGEWISATKGNKIKKASQLT